MFTDREELQNFQGAQLHEKKGKWKKAMKSKINPLFFFFKMKWIFHSNKDLIFSRSMCFSVFNVYLVRVGSHDCGKKLILEEYLGVYCMRVISGALGSLF